VHSEPRGFKRGIKHTGKKRAVCTCTVALFIVFAAQKKKMNLNN
jgi:hypothetical protein